ncbi:unnamed protein product [Phytomonas sp. EM1]|nr:unnamed protein product [Phytomonas sp. EM1]|eukprot:CCW59644.1 unnamed protein product [Phytomonas sp. isolate EM1]
MTRHPSGLHLPRSCLSPSRTDTLAVATCSVTDPLTLPQSMGYESLDAAAPPRGAQQPSHDIGKLRCNDPLASHNTTQGSDSEETHRMHPSPLLPSLVFHQKDLSDQDFRREAVLGQGSYSIVTSATHLPSGRLFALKELSRFHLRRNRMSRQLQWEINVHRKLRHPNVVRLYSYYVTSRYIHLVLELCPGGTILQRLRASAGGRLDELHASRYARHVARALEHIHRNGIAHRDLKLENVLLDARGVAKLADFGWSRSVCSDNDRRERERGRAEGEGEGEGAWQPPRRDAEEAEAEVESRRSESGESAASAAPPGTRLTVCGTLDYLSPEMVSGQPHTAKTDVWSLGAMIVEMLTGQPPFYHASQQETLEAIRTQAPNLCGRRSPSCPKPTSAHREMDEEKPAGGSGLAAAATAQDEATVQISPLARNLILSMLKKSPDERPTMEQVLQHPWLIKHRG